MLRCKNKNLNAEVSTSVSVLHDSGEKLPFYSQKKATLNLKKVGLAKHNVGGLRGVADGGGGNHDPHNFENRGVDPSPRNLDISVTFFLKDSNVLYFPTFSK